MIKNASKEVEDVKQAEFIIDGIEVEGMEITNVVPLYSTRENGTHPDDFHDSCDNKGPTISIYRSTKGYLSAGFTKVPWSRQYNYSEDKDAFVCSLTNEMRLFRPSNPANAVFHEHFWGPSFG